MTEAKLRTDIWIAAQVRLCDLAFIPCVVSRRGDPIAGAVLLKLNNLGSGCVVFSQTRDMEGALTWLRSTGKDPVPETDADQYIARQAKYDPDIWVIEIEDKDGRYEMPGPIS